MGGKYVKNTIVERVLGIIAPHPCSGCGKTGTPLCEDCKYDIIHEPFVGCILCARPQPDGVCSDHQTPFTQATVVGARTGTLQVLINALKFQNKKAAAKSLAELLYARLPLLPVTTRIIPVPTVSSHIRTRGYDQVLLIARHLSALTGLPVDAQLLRANSATQHTVGREQRAIQAKQAFILREEVMPDGAISSYPVLLIDDIITTGATITQAAEVLSSRHETIIVAALAYQQKR